MSRKNVFSYFMWFLYAAAVCGSLFRISGEFSRRMGYSGAAELVMGSLWLLLSGLFVFAVNKYIRNENKRKKEGKMISLVTESAIAVFLLGIGIFLRLYGIEKAGDSAAYFESAMVAEGQIIPPVVHGAVYWYLQLLHLVFVIFGNKLLAGIGLQILLQVVAAAFFYLAVRKLSGVFPALVMLGFIMAGPGMVEESLMLSPKMLLLVIYAAVLWAVVTGIKDKKPVLFYFLTGLFTSVVCYLDVIGISLVLLTVAGLILKEGEAPSGRWIKVSVAVSSCALGFALFMWVDSFVSSVSFMNVIRAWWQVFSPEGMTLPWRMQSGPITWDVLFLVLALTLGIFSFWRVRRDGQSLWILMALTFLLLNITGISATEIGTQIYLYIVSAVLAGIGTAGVVIREDRVQWVVEKQPESSQADNVKNEPESAEELPQVRFIENPLPLPKKHVRKVLDFDRELQEGMEEFDLEIAEDDDFDI